MFEVGTRVQVQDGVPVFGRRTGTVMVNTKLTAPNEPYPVEVEFDSPHLKFERPTPFDEDELTPL